VDAKINQRQSQLSWEPFRLLGSFDMTAEFGRRSPPPCDYRYCQYPSDNEEFQRGFRLGYDAGYRSAFNNKYDWNYDIAFRNAVSWGAAQATSGGLNLEDLREEAYETARQKAYEEAYQQALAQSREAAYTAAFKVAFSKSYAEFYPHYRADHYARVEEEAFQSIYGGPYGEAFARASTKSFDQTLPTARKEAYKQGRLVEKSDFTKRPVRILEAWITPTEIESISLVSVRLRNFSSESVAGHKVHLFFGQENSRLYHAIPANSEVVVTGAFRVNPGEAWPDKLAATLKVDDRDLSVGSIAVGERPQSAVPES
jgi:hypothetical protein